MEPLPPGNEPKNLTWDGRGVGRQLRFDRNRHLPLVVWLTGLSGSGKSTIAGFVEEMLFEDGISAVRLDGDNLRHGLNRDLGFSEADRTENIRRVGEVSRILFDFGHVVLCSFISPFQRDRQMVRSLLGTGEFVEVFVRAPLYLCETRDPKGLYRLAREGRIKQMTGIDSPYEEPASPEVTLDTEFRLPAESSESLYREIRSRIGR